MRTKRDAKEYLDKLYEFYSKLISYGIDPFYDEDIAALTEYNSTVYNKDYVSFIKDYLSSHVRSLNIYVYRNKLTLSMSIRSGGSICTLANVINALLSESNVKDVSAETLDTRVRIHIVGNFIDNFFAIYDRMRHYYTRCMYTLDSNRRRVSLYDFSYGVERYVNNKFGVIDVGHRPYIKEVFYDYIKEQYANGISFSLRSRINASVCNECPIRDKCSNIVANVNRPNDEWFCIVPLSLEHDMIPKTIRYILEKAYEEKTLWEILERGDK